MRDLSPERPLSVVVLGNSVAVLSIPPRTGADDGPWAEVVRDRLVAAKVPVRVAQSARWFDFAKAGLQRYQQDVRTFLPDVLVLQYGLNESQPWLVPVPLLRHFITEHDVTTRTGAAYREKVVAPVWKQVRRYRRWASPKVGMRTWQTTPHRFGEAMRQLIRTARYDGRPLVLVLDVSPPSGVLEHFLPGMVERTAVVPQVLADVVAGFDDPEVRLVRTADLVTEHGRQMLPDSMHYSPLGHRLVGERVAAEILDWLQVDRARA